MTRGSARAWARATIAVITALVVACTGTPSTSQGQPSTIFDGDPATTERVNDTDAIGTAVAVSRLRFPTDDSAAHAVLARHDAFADSLAGTPLAGAGPLLYTSTGGLEDAVAAELHRALPAQADVYLLGGTAALSQAVADSVTDAGFIPRRLAGPTRYETAAQIAAEVRRLHSDAGRIALARGEGPADNPTAAWADAITVGTWTARDGMALLLSPTESLHPAAAAALDAHDGTTVLLGGEAALSSGVAEAIEGPVRRVAGATRAGTAAAIATELLGFPPTGPRKVVVVNGYRDDGWKEGLLAGGIAADADGPVLLVGDDVPPETRILVGACGPPEVDVVVVGGTAAVSEPVVATLDALDGNACAPDGLVAGPRDLPATFVPLETTAFPRPAQEACADNTTVVDVELDDSIADALAAADPGTTVRVAAGTYVESPEDHRGLVMEVDDVCLRAREGAQVVLEAGPDQTVGLAISASDVVVEGITVRGFVTGVSLEPGEGDVQRAVTLQQIRVEDPAGDFREGIIAFGEGDPGGAPVLDGLLLSDVFVDGVDFGVSCNAGPCAHWWLEDVHVSGRGSTEGGSGADAFAVEDGRQVVVVDSSFTGVAADGIDTKATDVVLQGVTVRDVGRNGIKSWDGVDVLNALVVGTDADAAIVGESGARYRYAHMTVTGHAPGGGGYVGTWSYDAQEPVDLEIVNSIWADNSAGGLYVAPGSTVSISHSLFADTGAALLEIDGEGYAVADLARLEADGHGVDNLVDDPGFADPASGDYRLEAGSAAVDRGTLVPGLQTDLAGGPRVQGAAADLGPYESG